MLEEKLQGTLTELRREERDDKGMYNVVKTLFEENLDNLADGVEDLAFLCELPDDERIVLTYPVIGNFVLQEMEAFRPQTDHERKVYELMRKVVTESRFNNPHTRRFYEDPVSFTRIKDELSGVMFLNPEESMRVHKFMRELYTNHGNIQGILKKSGATYSCDFGHGISAPMRELTEYIATPFEISVRSGDVNPLNLTIMVVDDERPEEWYKRLIAAGFQEKQGQKGMFYDCETALEALETGHYDVILTDLELGDGKMGGIEFVERAYDVQKRKGITPMISVFSYSHEMLGEAERRLHPLHSREAKVMHQVDHNYKGSWTAYDLVGTVRSFCCRNKLGMF